jgi:hypothetical protein
VVAPPPPRPPTNAEIEASIASGANIVAADVEFRAKGRLRAACAEQNGKAYNANPGNLDAINKETAACMAAVGDGAKEEAQKAHACALQVLKANAARGSSDPNVINKELEPCYQLSAAAPQAAPTPSVAPKATPIPSTIAAPVAAPAQPVPPARTATTPAPATAPKPTVDPAAEAAARAKALQEQQQRAAEERAATQQRRAQEAQQRAQQAQACTQALMKAYPDGGRSDPEGFQKGFLACVQAQQALPAK